MSHDPLRHANGRTHAAFVGHLFLGLALCAGATAQEVKELPPVMGEQVDAVFKLWDRDTTAG